MRIIVNSDDLGLSSEVNAKIEECIQTGYVTSSTLIANAPFFEDGVRIAKQNPKISVGVHLNIIEFPPLTNVDIFKKHGIVGEDGCFIEGAIFCVKINEELRQAVFEEWDAQISKVEKAGLVPSHCDSHEHTHTIPSLIETLCQVLDKHNISKVRRKIIPSILIMIRERIHPTVHLNKSKAVQPQKRSLIHRRLHLFVVKYKSRRWNKQMLEKYKMTDAFFPFQSFYANYKVLSLGRRCSAVELMCHPGHKGYQIETENLMKGMSWLKERYELISYNEL